MSEQKVLIDCRDAALGYEGRPIWEHLTFQVRRGDYLCIVGDNGSGKSTLLKSMLGLLRPLSGEICLDESLRRGAIGYLPQQTRAQKDFPATVSEVVLSGFLSARGWKFFYTPAQKSQALQHMGKLGILELKDKCYRELSGGQQQRVLLARALCAAGELLILDEPLSGLDPINTDLFKGIIREEIEAGKYLIMSSHQMATVEEFCTDLTILARSRTVLQGHLNDIKKGYGRVHLQLKTEEDAGPYIAESGAQIVTRKEFEYQLKVTGQEQANDLLARLTRAGVTVVLFNLREPSLHEIFVETVGGESDA